ncbi:MFS transporter [Planobispora longispora]|uniref:MFS transporter n=1 Tax=Planobispora longispora TaxID=28887 RepID=A0A8J3REY0_9ACTN|nr:MFS transporter [Planobispora longispora]GIH73589.1 MFS transporter [Planobispora longispora]
MSTPPDNAPAERVATVVEPEPARVSGWFITVYALTCFGFYLTIMVPALFSLAYKVQLIDPAGKESSLGLIVGIGSLVGLVAGPVAGTLSDRTRLRWGRRRPFLVAGLVISFAGALVIVVAPSVPVTIVGNAIVQIAIACVSAGFNPVIAEWVPESQRGKIGGLGGVASALAGVGATLLGSMLTGSLLLLFLVPVLAFAVTVPLFLLTVPDRPARADPATGSIRDAFKDLLFNPRTHVDFSLVVAGKFALSVGTAFFSTYQLYFMLDRLGLTPEDAGRQLALAGGLGLVSMMSSAVLGGLFSDRLKRRKPFIYLSASFIAAGLATAAFAPSIPAYVLGTVLLMLGTGAFSSVDLALCSDVLPEKEKAGKYMSIYYLSGAGASALAPVLAPVILMIGGGGNYTVLFLSGALCALGAVVTAWRIRGVR